MNTTKPTTTEYAAILAEGLRDEIIGAYTDLVYEPGGYVMLTRLHAALDPSVPRAEVDAALAELYRTDRIRLIVEVNQRALTDADRAAAVVIGGEHKHLYRVTEES